MFDDLLLPLTLFALLGCGLMAGVFFAFSNFVMKALARTQGMASMQAINVTVLNPLFLGIFVGTAIACIALAIYSLLGSGSVYLLAGSALYVFGTFGVTMAFNVPLNNTLAGVDPSQPEALQAWRGYVTAWTRWNHVRTVAALAATAALALAL